MNQTISKIIIIYRSRSLSLDSLFLCDINTKLYTVDNQNDDVVMKTMNILNNVERISF